MYRLDRVTRIPASLEEVFAFFSDAGNLSRITPPWLQFRVHGSAPEKMEAGARIEYRIRWLVFPLRWVTPPAGFQDVQERGPYETWIHTHSFSAEGAGAGVLMRDQVDYRLPFGVFGRIAHRLAVRRQLEQIFEFRRRATERIFGAADAGPE